MEAIAKVQTTTATSISLRGDKSKPCGLGRGRKIANLDFPGLEEFRYNSFNYGYRKIELVWPGKSKDAFENGNGRCKWLSG